MLFALLASPYQGRMLPGPAAMIAQEDDEKRAAVRKAIPLLEKSARQYVEVKSCFSCHHQAVPLFALATAKTRGFEIDEGNFTTQAKYTWESLDGAKAKYKEGKGQGGTIATASYALWTLDGAGWK